jgi:mono/diheme cytochrome c family protein
MRITLFLASLLSISALSLTGCIGDIDDNTTPPDEPPGTESAGKKLFNTTVKDFLIAKCANCHTGEAIMANAFLGTAPATTAYDAMNRDRLVVGDYVVAQARILNKGIHGGIATFWDADQSAKITAWLTQEATDRGVSQDQPTTPPAAQKPTTSTICRLHGNFAHRLENTSSVSRGPNQYATRPMCQLSQCRRRRILRKPNQQLRVDV